MRVVTCSCLLVLTVLAMRPQAAGAGEPVPVRLAITGATVESSEDGPAVANDYLFFPGDYVYFAFEVAGFKRSGDAATALQKIALHYRVAVIDEQGTPLAPPEEGSIEQEVGSEDKNWSPKRRGSFLLPSYVAAGTYRVRIDVEDTLANATAETSYPFHMGGVAVKAAGQLSIENFRFFRSEQDETPLEMAAYRAGDTVWARFEMTGFRLAAANTAELQYGITVVKPDGKIIFDQKVAATEKIAGQFYAPQFVPGQFSVNTTSDLNRGEYKLVIHLRDLAGRQTANFDEKFRIE